MCTVSWKTRCDGYDLFFNRDEMKTRGIAEPPSRFERNGVAYLAPIDPDAGGSWIGVNEFGLTVCLMNGYGVIPREYGPLLSRGLLVLDLVVSDSMDAVLKRVKESSLASFRPFTLVTIESGKKVLTCDWDGLQVNVNREVDCPLISSSIQFPRVLKHRKLQFAKLPEIRANYLQQFHSSHEPETGPTSVCMHRQDAETVSLSRIQVTGKVIQFHYTPGAPCQTEFQPPVSLKKTRR